MIQPTKRLLMVAALCLGSLLYAQRDNPTDADKILAKELLADYPDDEVVIKNQDIYISFDKNRSSGKVEATVSKHITFFSISNRATIGYSTGYDNESSIEKLELRSRRDRKQEWEIEDEAYSDESIFHNDYRVQFGKLNFPLQGYTLSVEEEKEYQDIKYLTSQYFVEPYRIIEGTVTFKIPSWLDLEIKEFNVDTHDIKRTEKEEEDFRLVTYTLKRIPPSKREYLMPGSSYVYPHVLLLSKSFIDSSGEEQILFKETKDLYAWYRQLVNEVKIEESAIDEKVQELVQGLEKDEEKIKAIYYWVQDNIKYIAFEDGLAGFQPDAPQNVFEKRYGDCKGMAILLKTMLSIAGFDARLVWIGTDHIAYDYSTPSLSVDNHMISAIMIDGEPVFLDGTEKFNKFGSFATRIQGKQAMIENGDDFILKKVPESNDSANTESYDAKLNMEGADLVADISRTFSGEGASSFLYRFTNVPLDKREEVLLRVLKDGNENASIELNSSFDPADRDNDLSLQYSMRVKNSVSEFDNTYYMELDPVRYLAEAQLDVDRQNPLMLSHKGQETKNFNLKLPSGISVSSLPEPLDIDNKYLRIKKSYQQQGDQVVYTSQIAIKKRMIAVEDFSLWNESIKRLKSFYDEQVVLKKS
ncbi:transglutaminase domain-containing protein [Nonlabens xiamenensis]|uniref:transglutaminase domain-containing protein n=1 Tax=Nonlabens xiamenensis TaxID=2341043 RepID=UPI000F605580|nr:transglutaminase domain-containing protein [Nonlabens xiamenensis]